METKQELFTNALNRFETVYGLTTEIIQLHGKTLSIKIYRGEVMIMYARREGSGFKTFPGHETGQIVEDFDFLCRRAFNTNTLLEPVQ